MMAFTIPIKTVAGLNAREHWRVRAKRVKGERTCAYMHVAARMSLAALPCVVTMVRQSPGELDDDNLQGACKAVRDGIADALGVPDNDKRIQWRYAQEKCKRGEFGVRIEIAPA